MVRVNPLKIFFSASSPSSSSYRQNCNFVWWLDSVLTLSLWSLKWKAEIKTETRDRPFHLQVPVLCLEVRQLVPNPITVLSLQLPGITALRLLFLATKKTHSQNNHHKEPRAIFLLRCINSQTNSQIHITAVFFLWHISSRTQTKMHSESTQAKKCCQNYYRKHPGADSLLWRTNTLTDR